jgi:hypothetical protein
MRSRYSAMTFGIEARSSHLWEAQTIVVSDTWDKSQTESPPYFQDLSYPKTARCAALHHTNCFDLEILGAMIQVPLLRRLEVMRINGHHLHRGSRVGRHEDHRGYAAIDGK